MTVDRRHLPTIHKELEAVARQTEALIESARKLDKTYAAETRKANGGAKKKKAALRRKVAFKKTTDRVINPIKKSNKDVDVASLMKKTGFDKNQVRSMLAKSLNPPRGKPRGIFTVRLLSF